MNKRPYRAYTLCALGAAVLASILFLFGIFSGIEASLNDRLFTETTIDPSIAVIAIDDASLATLGQWPLPRATYALLLQKLALLHPKALAIDVVFSEPSRLESADDATFADALRTAAFPVILPVEITPEGKSISILSLFTKQHSTSGGHVHLTLDADGVVRRFPRTIAYKDPSLVPIAGLAETTIDATRTTPSPFTFPEGMMRIHYTRAPGHISTVSLANVLADKDGERLKNKIIFLGATATDLHDTEVTPLSRGKETAGIEIQAQIANMFLTGDTLTDTPWEYALLALCIAALFPLCAARFSQRPAAPLIGGILAGVLWTLVVAVLFETNIVAPIIYPHIAWILSAAVLMLYRHHSEQRERSAIIEVFGKYVSKQVLERILENPSAVKLGGEERVITVLFSDIRGFTTLSEKLTPPELVRILNTYLTAMTDIVLAHDGVLDKYIGDAVMAFWGAPLEDAAQTEKAIRAAHEMIARLKTLNEELRATGDPEIAIGIGIHTGPAIVGNTGSSKRFDYTILGDTVNTAARLESATKEYGVPLIVSAAAKNAAPQCTYRPLGNATLKGKTQAIEIYTTECAQ